MEFRLIYDGKLPAEGAGGTRRTEKHEIRRVFSKQLRELWSTHPRLRLAFDAASLPDAADPVPARIQTHLDVKALEYSRCRRHFVPLIEEKKGLACALDILFLRRDQPGGLIKSGGGDIDNRIKVLFDALRMPSNCDEVDGKPEDDDDPFFCLLEDDRLITEVKVTTDRLLTPLAGGENRNDVRLIIHVRTVILDASDIEAAMY